MKMLQPTSAHAILEFHPVVSGDQMVTFGAYWRGIEYFGRSDNFKKLHLQSPCSYWGKIVIRSG